VKTWEESGADVSLGAAAGTHVVSKIDAISGVRQVSFDSEEAAFNDWRSERSVSCGAVLGEESQSEFVSNYLDGRKSVNGIVWNREAIASTFSVSVLVLSWGLDAMRSLGEQRLRCLGR
ncbi:hypothetical protein THAOC_24134, partial [Thalassiosira oceanica]